MKKIIKGGAIDLREAILQEMRQFPQHRHTLKTLTSLGGDNSKEGRAATLAMLQQLLQEGVIEECGSGRYRLSRKHLPVLEGKVDMMPSGSMYVKVEGRDDDVYVDEQNGCHALDGEKFTL